MSEINEKAVALALNPEEGAEFEYGGKAFKLQFLSVDGEQRLLTLVEPGIKKCIEAGDTSQTRVMRALRDVLPQAVAIILSDYDPTVTEDWVRSVRGKAISYQLYAILTAQFEVQEMGKLLADHLLIDAHLSASETA